jgi:hypothetical protein
MHLFPDFEPDDNRRPDILIRNPYGSSRQIIIDVAVTVIDSTTRTNDDKPDQPVVARRKQKTRKYRPTAIANGLDFHAPSFSYAAEWTWLSKIFFFNVGKRCEGSRATERPSERNNITRM